NDLAKHKKIVLDFVHIERSEIEETGEYDLEGLFIRLGHAIDSIHAKRVVLDTIEALFSGLPNPLILRAELRRLFRWLKEKGVTAIITGERGDEKLTRQGLEEYVSDCVIVLDHRITAQASTRRLRVVKYRGSIHGTNEYPFLIDESGISLLPITSLGLQHTTTNERISSGIPRLDGMLGGMGFYRGSSVLISGTAGTGKTSFAAHVVDAACRRGERVLYFAFEESANQIMRNMRSIGIDLQLWVQHDLLHFEATRPSFAGLEMHLTLMHKAINHFRPQVVVVDPLNSFVVADNVPEVKAMLMRLVDFLKQQQITGLFTSLTSGGDTIEQTDVAISSPIDTWLLLRSIELGGERNRGLYILKSRGMAHSNQIREFLLTDHGVELRDVYVGPSGVLTGSARLTQEAQEHAAQLLRQQEVDRKRLELQRKRTQLEAQISAMRTAFAEQEADLLQGIEQEQLRETLLLREREDMAQIRKADTPSDQPAGGPA
ncbi:MAG: circadian clock protein KaiC, partial [Chloroflexales bacterium]